MNKKKKEVEGLTDLGQLINGLISDYRKVGLPVDKGKVECDFIDTGNFALNYIMSGSFDSGLPVGQVTEIHGDPSTGKSLLLYNIIANFLTKYPDGVVILDDTEQAYVQYLGSKLNIDESRLIRISSATVEDHVNMIFRGGKVTNQSGEGDPEIDVDNPIVRTLIDKGVKRILIAVDSVAVMSTKHELAIGLDKPDMSKAKVLKALLRVVMPEIKKHDITYIVTNHLIFMIGSMIPMKVTPGGGGIVYQSSIRLCLSTAGKLKMKDTNVIAGVTSKVTTVKNRFAPPYRNCELEILFNEGMSRYSGIISLLTNLGVVELAPGGWYRIKEVDYKFQSKDLKAKWEEIREILKSKNVLQRVSEVEAYKGEEGDIDNVQA